MLSLRRPSTQTLQRVRDDQANRGFTYPDVGATGRTPPSGYVVDHTRAVVGHGERAYCAARTVLHRWAQFPPGWTETWPQNLPLKTGETVVVTARTWGLWWINACRIVFVIDEAGPIHRYGFAYGTLPEHVESGEERFLVEWNETDSTVSYDILAFSRPNTRFAKLGKPIARRTQKRFARDSAAAMTAEVSRIITSQRSQETTPK